MSSPNWDDPDLKLGGDYFAFNTLNDEIVGVIAKVTLKDDTMRSKKVVDLTFTLDDGTEKTVTAGQYDLARQVLDLRPAVGARMSIKWARTEPSGKASPKKLFDIKYRAPGAATPAAAPVTVPDIAPDFAPDFDDSPPF